MMQIIEATTIIDDTEHLNLDIATALSPGQVKVRITIESILAIAENQNYDFSDLVGLSWQGNAVAQQRLLRDEW